MKNTIKLNNNHTLEVRIYANDDIAQFYFNYMLEKYDIYSRKSNLSGQDLEDLYNELEKDITLASYMEHVKLDMYELHELISTLSDDIDDYDHDDLGALTLDGFYNLRGGIEQLADIFHGDDGINTLNKMLGTERLVGYTYLNNNDCNDWDHFYFILDENQAGKIDEFYQDLDDFQAAVSGDAYTVIIEESDRQGATIAGDQYEVLSNDICEDMEKIIANHYKDAMLENYNPYELVVNY